MASIGIKCEIFKHQDLPGIQLVEVEELVVAHNISTSYPRRSEALEETPDATITTTVKDSA